MFSEYIVSAKVASGGVILLLICGVATFVFTERNYFLKIYKQHINQIINSTDCEDSSHENEKRSIDVNNNNLKINNSVSEGNKGTVSETEIEEILKFSEEQLFHEIPTVQLVQQSQRVEKISTNNEELNLNSKIKKKSQKLLQKRSRSFPAPLLEGILEEAEYNSAKQNNNNQFHENNIEEIIQSNQFKSTKYIEERKLNMSLKSLPRELKLIIDDICNENNHLLEWEVFGNSTDDMRIVLTWRRLNESKSEPKRASLGKWKLRQSSVNIDDSGEILEDDSIMSLHNKKDEKWGTKKKGTGGMDEEEEERIKQQEREKSQAQEEKKRLSIKKEEEKKRLRLEEEEEKERQRKRQEEEKRRRAKEEEEERLRLEREEENERQKKKREEEKRQKEKEEEEERQEKMKQRQEEMRQKEKEKAEKREKEEKEKRRKQEEEKNRIEEEERRRKIEQEQEKRKEMEEEDARIRQEQENKKRRQEEIRRKEQEDDGSEESKNVSSKKKKNPFRKVKKDDKSKPKGKLQLTLSIEENNKVNGEQNIDNSNLNVEETSKNQLSEEEKALVKRLLTEEAKKENSTENLEETPHDKEKADRSEQNQNGENNKNNENSEHVGEETSNQRIRSKEAAKKMLEMQRNKFKMSIDEAAFDNDEVTDMLPKKNGSLNISMDNIPEDHSSGKIEVKGGEKNSKKKSDKLSGKKSQNKANDENLFRIKPLNDLVLGKTGWECCMECKHNGFCDDLVHKAEYLTIILGDVENDPNADAEVCSCYVCKSGAVHNGCVYRELMRLKTDYRLFDRRNLCLCNVCVPFKYRKMCLRQELRLLRKNGKNLYYRLTHHGEDGNEGYHPNEFREYSNDNFDQEDETNEMANDDKPIDAMSLDEIDLDLVNADKIDFRNCIDCQFNGFCDNLRHKKLYLLLIHIDDEDFEDLEDECGCLVCEFGGAAHSGCVQREMKRLKYDVLLFDKRNLCTCRECVPFKYRSTCLRQEMKLLRRNHGVNLYKNL